MSKKFLYQRPKRPHEKEPFRFLKKTHFRRRSLRRNHFESSERTFSKLEKEPFRPLRKNISDL